MLFRSGSKIEKIINKIQNKGVGVLWDIHHPFRAGESLDETYRKVGTLIKHVHIKDEIEGKLCLTGKGTLPIKELVTLLKEKGYPGYLSFEWEKMWVKELEDPEIAFPQYVEYMKSII